MLKVSLSLIVIAIALYSWGRPSATAAPPGVNVSNFAADPSENQAPPSRTGLPKIIGHNAPPTKIFVAADPAVIQGEQIYVNLRRGWNVETGLPTAANCVTGLSDHSTAPVISKTLGEVDDIGSLAKGLDISAHAQARFLVASADLETKYVENHKFDFERLNVAVRGSARITESLQPAEGQEGQSTLAVEYSGAKFIPTDYSESIEIIDKYKRLLNEKDGVTKFRSICGDGYVVASTSGADIIGLASLATQNSEDTQSVQIKMNGSYLGQSANVNLDSFINEISKKRDFKLTSQQIGGNFPEFDCGNLSTQECEIRDLRNKLSHLQSALNSCTKEEKCLKQFKVVIAVYGPQTVSNWPGGSWGLPSSALDVLMTKYWEFANLYQRIDEIQQHPGDYLLNWGVTDASLSETKDKVHAAQLSLDSAIKTCMNNSADACSYAATHVAVPEVYEVLATLPLPRWFIPADAATNVAFVNMQNTVTDYNANADKEFMALTACSDPRCSTPPCQAAPPPLPGPFGSRTPPTCFSCLNEQTGYACDHPFTQWSQQYYDNNFYPRYVDLINSIDNFAALLRPAIRTYRLAEYNRVRCGIAPDDADCITDAQIEHYAAGIRVKPPRVNMHGAIPWGDQRIWRCCRPMPRAEAAVTLEPQN